MIRKLADALIKHARMIVICYYTLLQKRLNKLTTPFTPPQPVILTYLNNLYSEYKPYPTNNREDRSIHAKRVSQSAFVYLLTPPTAVPV